MDENTYTDHRGRSVNENIVYTDDGLGCTTPEIHLFTEQGVSQNEKEVRSWIKQSDLLKRKDWPEGILDAPAHHKPCLMFDDAPKCEAENMPKCSERAANVKEPAEITALWRKLSGVRPKENVEMAKVVPTIMDTILLTCKRKFMPGLTVGWSDDHWNACLVINGAKTKIRAESLVTALEGLSHITDEDDAARIVADVVVKKLERLFI